MVAVEGVSAGAGALLGILAQWVVAIVAAMVLAFLVIDRFGTVQITALVLGVLAAIFWSFVLPAVLTLLFAPRIYGISVAEAPGQRAAGLVVFTDGIVRTDLVGEADETDVYRDEDESWNTRTTETRYRVAPLVYEGWRASEPVPAWVACTDTIGDYGYLEDRLAACTKAWSEDYRAGYAPPRDLRDGLDAAIGNAERVYDLVIDYSVPVLVWSANPRAALAREARPGLAVILLLHLAWCMAVPIAWLRRRRRAV